MSANDGTCYDPKRTCPMDGATAVQVMSTLTEISTKLEANNKLQQERQDRTDTRLKNLENTVGRRNAVAAMISAVTAGVTLGVGWLMASLKGGDG